MSVVWVAMEEAYAFTEILAVLGEEQAARAWIMNRREEEIRDTEGLDHEVGEIKEKPDGSAIYFTTSNQYSYGVYPHLVEP